MRRLSYLGSLLIVSLSFSGVGWADEEAPGNPDDSDAPDDSALSTSGDPLGEIPDSKDSTSPLLPSSDEQREKAWHQAFQAAIRAMQEGRYLEAEKAFAQLAAKATTPHQRTSALHHQQVSGYWASRELVVVRSKKIPRKPTSREQGIRTPTEIMVLYTHAVWWGIGSGALLISHREPTNFAEFALPLTATTGLAIGAVAVADSGKPLGYGVGQSIASGMQIGLAQGILLVSYHDNASDKDERWSDKVDYGILWGGATAGAVTGGILGSTFDTTPGRASFLSSAAIWSGFVAGTATAALDGDRGYGPLVGAIGLNTGLIASALTATPISPSHRRMRYVDLGGVLGTLGGVGIAALTSGGENGDSAYGWLALGAATGLTISWTATMSMPKELRWEEEQKASTPLRLHVGVTPLAGGAALQVGAAL